MKILTAACFLALIFSFKCHQNLVTERVSFTHLTVSGHQEKHIFIIKIPPYLKKNEILTGECFTEYQFVYTDTSMIYAGNLSYTPNNHNITNAGLDSIKLVYQRSYLNMNNKSDTLFLEGRDLNGLYWKEIRVNDIYWGFVKVLPSQKEVYEKSLKIKFKKK